MKKSTISMISSESLQLKKTMFITVLTVMLCTTSSFGKTNSQPRRVNNGPRMEMRENSQRMEPRHEMEPRPEMRPHKHEFNRHTHECNICHMHMDSPSKPMPHHSVHR